MLIGIDAHGWQWPFSKGRGVGRYVENLIAALHRHDRTNDYVLYLHDLYPRERLPWEVEPDEDSSGRPGKWTVRSVPSLDYLINECPDPLDALLLTLPFCHLVLPRHPHRGVKLFSLVFDVIPFLNPEHYLSDARFRHLFYNSLQSLAGYDALFAISESAKSDCEAILGLAPGRVTNIGCATRIDFFAPPETGVLTEANQRLLASLGIQGPYVYNVGGRDPRKNVEGLIRAFDLLPDDLKRSHQLVITYNLADGDSDRLHKLVAGRGSRLVLTESVPDETLRVLYQHCDLFVFPSDYEGFGLPILEAMLCGAPVIAGRNSSQAEVVGAAGLLVNTTDALTLAGAMRDVLQDPAVRAQMIRHGLEQGGRFQWDQIAQRTQRAIERVASPGQAAVRPRANFDRPNLALFAPLPPRTSRSADQTEGLLRELAKRFRIDYYHDCHYLPHEALANLAIRAYDYRLFRPRAAALDYRGVLYCMGGKRLDHQYVYDALQRHPGVVVLDDFYLGDFQFESARAQGRPGLFVEELRYCHGDSVSAELLEGFDLNTGRELFTQTLRDRGLPMNRRIFEHATSVIVHSHGCREAAARMNGDWAKKISMIPFGTMVRGRLPAEERARIRASHGLPSQALLFGSFGATGPCKLSEQSLIAFQAVARANPTARFVFVGTYRHELHRVASELGIGERIHVLGRVTPDDYFRLAGAIDIGVNVRRPPADREASTNLLALLSAGTPAIVTTTDLPSGAAVPITWGSDFEGRLTRAMLALAADQTWRERLGAAALACIQRDHDWGHVADLYAEVIHRLAPHGAPPLLNSARRIAG